MTKNLYGSWGATERAFCVSGPSGGQDAVLIRDRRGVAVAYVLDGGPGDREYELNKLAIIAVPDLLEALEAILDSAGKSKDESSRMTRGDAIDIIEGHAMSAIAKAKGESP